MGMLSEYTGNGNPPAPGRQREEIKAQLDGVLQQLDVLPSRFDRLLFKYICVYMLSLLCLAESLVILSLLSGNTHIGEALVLGVGFGVPPALATLLILWRFNVWRGRIPNTLRDLIEQKRIALPDGDAATSYLRFLEHYRHALASPKRYLLSGLLMLFIGSVFLYHFVQELPHEPNGVTIFVVEHLLSIALYLALFLGGFYCLGLLLWAMSISGGYVRKLVRAFELSIQPFHPDQCGGLKVGLKVLGDFCFGLGSPLLLASGLLIGYSLFALVVYATPLYARVEVSDLVLNVYAPLLSVLLVLLPVIVLVFIFPLWALHRKMVSEAKTNETSYFTRTEALREEIKALLATKQVEAAKAVHEEKALVESLYAPYPVWPFRVRSKISSTALEVGGSLLIGLLSAAVVEYFLPVIITLLFHTA